MRRTREQLIEQLGDDYDRFYGNEGLWRNDDHPEEIGDDPPITASTFHTHATDHNVAETEYYRLDIAHVRHWFGKGFLPVVHFKLADSRGNGHAFTGTDQAAYDKAVKQGREMLESSQRRMDEEHERQERWRQEREQQPE